MNGLTDRLQMIADEIKQGETMADIGTDHGFLPLFLWENGISPSVIMCDISEPSLAKAKAAAGAYQFGQELDFRAGDGLKILRSGEVDAVVIAGMGGLLIRDILAADIEKTVSFGKYIFQPRNNAAHLRYWLVSNGFRIIKNQLVREGKFICEVITALPPKPSENGDMGLSDTLPSPDDPCWDLPEDLMSSQPDLAREYAAVKLGIEQKILEGMHRSSNVADCELRSVERRIDYFRSYGYEV
ncbi:MAG: SAM-dependent methyltransferase [Firmicutes bacterium]|nr:SAM-dependent methyltransferase [Bacillota bacterium]